MLIPSLFLFFLILKKGDKFGEYFSKEILDKLSVSNQYFSNKSRNIIMFISLIFMIIALARPVTNEKNIETNQKINSVIIAIDVSKSMLANDIFPNRLSFAKEKTINLINEYKEFAIGVIVFAKDAFILSPLTQDLESLKYLVNNLDYSINFNNGTNIYNTIEASNKLLKEYENKNIILLTDGASKENFDAEINLAKQNNIKVFTIATATKKPTAIKLKNNEYLTNDKNEVVTVALNEKIKELSLNTNAGYINFTLDNQDIKKIKNEITSSFSNKEFKSKRHKTYTELFYYPLALSILLLLIAFSSVPKIRKVKTSANSFLVLFILLFIQEDIKASIFDFKYIDKGEKAYKNKEYEKAYDNFSEIKHSNEKEYNIANSLYKQKKFKEAIKRYKNVKTDDRNLKFNKLHNLGNAYANNNQYKEAIQSYEDALKIKNDKETKENLETIKKHLNRQKQKDKNHEKNENKKNPNNKESKLEKSKKENKNSQDKNKENKQKSNEKKLDNKEHISKQEEDKWLKKLENQNKKIFLQKVPSKNNYETKTAW